MFVQFNREDITLNVSTRSGDFRRLRDIIDVALLMMLVVATEQHDNDV